MIEEVKTNQEAPNFPVTISQFKALIERYNRDANKANLPCHPFFEDLAFNTVKNYKHGSKILLAATDEEFPIEYGGQSETLSAGHAQKIVDNLIADRGPGAARAAVACMGSILSYMILYTRISTSTYNAFDHVKIPNGHVIGAWTDEQIKEHRTAHKAMLVTFLTDILLCTGQRLSDAIRIAPQNVKNGKITIVQQKTGRTVILPIHVRLEDWFRVIVSQREVEVSDSPAPYIGNFVRNPTENNVRYFYQKECERIGIKPLQLHGLRKSAVIKMIESGATLFEVMAVTGHKSVSSLKHYMDGYDQIAAAERAFAKVEAHGK